MKNEKIKSENLIIENCECCNGTGLVNGEHFDDIQGCHNCLGSGKLKYKTKKKLKKR